MLIDDENMGIRFKMIMMVMIMITLMIMKKTLILTMMIKMKRMMMKRCFEPVNPDRQRPLHWYRVESGKHVVAVDQTG